MSNRPGRLPPRALPGRGRRLAPAAASRAGSSVARADDATDRQRRRQQERHVHAVASPSQPPSHGPEHEADAERHADHAERLRAILRRGVVGDVGLRGRQVAGGEAVEDAADEHHPQRRRVAEHEEADARAGLADEQQRLAAVPIAELADDRRRDQRAHRVDRHDRRRDQLRRAEPLGVEREQRDHDREPEHIDEDDQEDR